VYGFTSSPVQRAILRLFVRCECVLPNLFVGTLTRESVSSAVASGIAADDIVAYLREHAHAQVAGRVPVVPEVRRSDAHHRSQWDTLCAIWHAE
jgi:transcription initiation factor TFIIH subunit 4